MTKKPKTYFKDDPKLFRLHYRDGILSDQDKEYIIRNRHLPIEELSHSLLRREKQIYNFLNTLPKVEIAAVSSDEYDIESLPEWNNIKKQFNKEECSFYKYRWGELIKQFHQDMVYTEQMQIHHLIKSELLLERNLIRRNESQQDIISLKKEINELKNQPDKDEATKNFLASLIERVSSLESSQSEYTREYETIQKRHADTLKQLKGTRDQRLDKIEKSGKNFIDVIKTLTNIKTQRQEAETLALINEAIRREQLRLNEPIEYIKGDVDRPLLEGDAAP